MLSFQTFRLKAEQTADRLPDLIARAEHIAASIHTGEHGLRKSGTGQKFWQFREYAPQDRPQDIDWRQSGKTDSLFIRQKERQSPQSVLFWCDPDQNMDYTSSSRRPKKSDYARVVAMALAIVLARSGERVGSMAGERTGHSALALEALGRSLLDDRDQPSLSGLRPWPRHRGATIIAASDFLQDADVINSALTGLTAPSTSGVLLQVLDRAEMNLPWTGRVIFETPGGQFKEPIQNVSSVRELYQARIQNHISAVGVIARRAGWHHVVCPTDAPPESVLQSLLKLPLFHMHGAPP